MADKDTITKDYMQDSETFADAFNFLIYGGKQAIKPSSSDRLIRLLSYCPMAMKARKFRYRGIVMC